MDLLVGHRLAKGRPQRDYLQTGDTVDSWKVIIVEEEKQLTLLFGMKAPGLGRLSFTINDKGDHREPGRARLVAPARYARTDLLAADDPGAPVYFPRYGATHRPAGRTNLRQRPRISIILS
ncbi:hypothetical protein LNP25_17960 [Klebsiella variicola subsp. variicola]|nr:hypothetical protein [Klebsiella variicola subsp. variicola]